MHAAVAACLRHRGKLALCIAAKAAAEADMRRAGIGGGEPNSLERGTVITSADAAAAAAALVCKPGVLLRLWLRRLAEVDAALPALLGTAGPRDFLPAPAPATVDRLCM